MKFFSFFQFYFWCCSIFSNHLFLFDYHLVGSYDCLMKQFNELLINIIFTALFVLRFLKVDL